MTNPYRNSPLKVFVVDDDRLYANLVIRSLESDGFTNITYINSGEKCLIQLQDDEKPDVVLLDHSMLGLNGLETLRHIKKTYPDIHVLFLSGQENPEIAVSSLKLGAFDYIIKGDNEFEQISKIMHRIRNVRVTVKQETSGQLLPGLQSLRDLIFNREKNSESEKDKPFSSLLPVIITLISVLSLSSCATQNMFSGTVKKNGLEALLTDSTKSEYTIRKDDKISVSIWNHDDLSVGSIYGVYNSNEAYGKWLMVDQKGNIVVPSLGEIKAEGKTVLQLRDDLTKSFSKDLVNPIVDVKVLNREVSLIGEVQNPGKFQLEKEKNTLVETLAMAGDFQPYADKKHVKLIREKDGSSTEFIIDLTKLDPAMQDQLLVMPGDVIYVPSRKGKMFDIKVPSIIPFASIVTAAAIVYTTVGR